MNRPNDVPSVDWHKMLEPIANVFTRTATTHPLGLTFAEMMTELQRDLGDGANKMATHAALYDLKRRGVIDRDAVTKRNFTTGKGPADSKPKSPIQPLRIFKPE